MTNLLIYAGDDRDLQWPVTDSAGNPLDITTWTARAQVRAYPGAPLLQEWTSGNGRAVTGNGTVTLLVDDSETYAWRSGDWDLFLVDPQGHWERLDGGQVRVVPSVTTAADV